MRLSEEAVKNTHSAREDPGKIFFCFLASLEFGTALLEGE